LPLLAVVSAIGRDDSRACGLHLLGKSDAALQRDIARDPVGSGHFKHAKKQLSAICYLYRHTSIWDHTEEKSRQY
jgi:hypothetical protein